MPPSVGWFKDVVELSIELDDSLYTVVQFDGHPRKCFLSDRPVKGKIVLTAPEGKSLQHRGVTFAFTTDQLNAGHDGPMRMLTHELPLLEPGSLEGRVALDFEVDLSSFDGLPASVAGPNFSLEHLVRCKFHRPWWSFSVEKAEALLLVEPVRVLPACTLAAEERSLEVEGFGGSCVLTLDKLAFSVDEDEVSGSVVFSGMADSGPIAEVALILGRTDVFNFGQEKDEEVRKWLLHTPPAAALTADATLPFSIPIAEGNDPRRVLPSMPLWKASGIEEGLLEPQVGANCWIRLVVVSAEPNPAAPGTSQTWWNTRPVSLHSTAGGAGDASGAYSAFSGLRLADWSGDTSSPV